jgi:hypothetical protein
VNQTREAVWLLALRAAGLMLATARIASAQPPIAGTAVSTFSESFSEPFFCGDGAVKHGDVLVETDTDFLRAVAHGSDGSRALVRSMHISP